MFSMCSELTPRAPVPDNRIPQLMQPWVHQIHKLLEQLKLIPGQNMEVKKLLLSFIGWNSMHLV